jgi:hypothetical protein
MSSKKVCVKLLLAYLQSKSLEIQSLLALKLVVTVDFSRPSAIKPYNPITLYHVLRSTSFFLLKSRYRQLRNTCKKSI